MTASISLTRIALLLPIAFFWLESAGAADSLRLVSVRDPAFGSPAGGNGDSYVDSVSPDGRFVLFGSSAVNLVTIKTNQPLPSLLTAVMNVYLRDRAQGTTALVSANVAGDGGGNDVSYPTAVSTNGRYALFESSASNLVPNDTNNAPDIFLRDLVLNQTLLVSIATNGAPANGPSRSSAMTPDGRYVAFVSEADNLVPGDTNHISDIFVRDMALGVTTLVSVGATSSTGTNYYAGGSESPFITPDGRYVAFYSTATGLYPDVPTNSGTGIYGDVYVRDLVAGQTRWASVGARAALFSEKGATNGSAFSHCISDDGQFVAFEATPLNQSSALVLRFSLASEATELIHTNALAVSYAGDYSSFRNIAMTPDGRFLAFPANTNGLTSSTTCILVWDANTARLELASGDLTNLVPEYSISDSPAITASGRFVAFISDASTLVTNETAGEFHLYVRDRQTSTTALIDADADGVATAEGVSTAPCLSADGSVIAFECYASSLVAGDSNNAYDVFVRNLSTGALEMISVHHPDLPSLTPNGASDISDQPASADAQRIAFSSEASDLVTNDFNGLRDVFVRDLAANTTLLVSVNTNGVAADGYSEEPSISADGRFVAFTSAADDLMPGDTNNVRDVFIRELQTGTTTPISISTNGVSPGDRDSYSPFLSADGKYVVFRSRALNLAPVRYFTSYSTDNLFLRDLQASITYAVSTNGASTHWASTPDAALVAFYSIPPNAAALHVWDRASGADIYSNSVSSVTALGLSPDGSKLAYATNLAVGTAGELWLVDLKSGTNYVLNYLLASLWLKPTARPCLLFSSDGQFFTFGARTKYSGTNQVYIADLQAQTVLMVSKSYETGVPSNADSDMPAISSDGRFIAYRSQASDIVPNDLNGAPDIFLYDRLNGVTTLISSSQFGNYTADNRSQAPSFSADGRTLVFTSWASDLIPGDFNGWSDVFLCSIYSSAPIPLFRVTVAGDSQGSYFTWAALPGKTYRAQFKTNLNDAQWQDLSGQVTIVGNQGYLRDFTPGVAQRFYRILAY